MLNIFRTIVLAQLLIPVCATLHAQNIANDTDNTFSAFSALQLSLTQPPRPLQGDTVQLHLDFQANVSGSVVLHLYFPSQIAPPDQGVGETDRDSIINVDSGSAYTYTFPMRLFNYWHVAFASPGTNGCATA